MPPPLAPPAPNEPGWAAQPLASEAEKKSGCFGIASGVMFGILGAVVLLVGGCTALLVLSTDGDDLVSVATSTTQSASSVEAADDESPDGDEPEALDVDQNQTGSEFDDIISCTRVDEENIVVEVVNNSPKTSSYLLTIGYFDETGQRLADEPSFVNYLRSGEHAVETQFVFEPQGTVCEVIGVERFAAESIASELAEISECELGAEPDVFGDFQATVSATNGSPQTSSYSIEAAFVDAEGVRRGTGSAFIDSVRTGETAPGDLFSATTFAEGYTCEIVGVTRNAS